MEIRLAAVQVSLATGVARTDAAKAVMVTMVDNMLFAQALWLAEKFGSTKSPCLDQRLGC